MQNTDIHPTAVIASSVEIGKNCKIGPYAVIEEEAQIGDNNVIDSFAQIKSCTSIGKGNHVHSFACLGGPPQDLKYQGEKTRLEIGNNNVIREYVTLNKGTSGGGGVTSIGSDCLIMAYAHVAHDCLIGDKVVLANAATLAGHVLVDNNAVIGGLSAVHQFVRIGEYAYIGGMTGVAQDVPPYMLIAGERGWLHGVNSIGLKRWGFSSFSLQALKKSFKTIWRSGLSKEQACENLLQEYADFKEITNLVNFIKTSERGVISPKSKK